MERDLTQMRKELVSKPAFLDLGRMFSIHALFSIIFLEIFSLGADGFHSSHRVLFICSSAKCIFIVFFISYLKI